MILKKRIAFYLDNLATAAGRAINLIIIGLVLQLSAIFVADTYPISGALRDQLHIIDTTILLFFALEHLICFWFAKT